MRAPCASISADGSDRELPLILGLMPVLPKHAIDVATFENSTLAKPIGSGPYVVAAIDAGKSVTFKRDPNYWGRDLPINRGLWNFDEVRFDYYRDANAYFEAFKAGLYDVRSETDPGRWQTGYDFPAVRDGRIVKEAFPSGLPKFASDFVFNTRRPIFADIRVRQAISLLFDFQWINRNFFYDLYQRSASYFDDSELSAYHRPADERERALLAPFPDAVRPDVLDGTWSPPVSDGSGRDRATLRQALELLRAAGYELDGTTLRDRATHRAFSFEIMVTDRDEERLALDFAGNLARAGINAQVRLVDAVQYDQRRSTFDFDMIEYRWEQSLSPGNEQSFYWGSAAANEDGSRNYMGVRSPAVDAMIAAMLSARQRADFVARGTRARPRLDFRLLRRAAVLSAGAMGGAVVLHRSIRRGLRCTDICRKPGGVSRRERCNDPRRCSACHCAGSGGAEPRDARRYFPPRCAAAAGRAGAGRSAKPHDVHRRRAAAADFCRSRPHGDGDRRPAAANGARHRRRSSAFNCPIQSKTFSPSSA